MPSVSSPELWTTEPSAPPLFLPRTLYVATSSGNGGIERYSVQIAARLRARGVPLEYACRPGSFVTTQCHALGIPTNTLRLRNSGDLGAARQLARMIVAQRSEIVHVHSRRDYVTAMLGVAWARRRLEPSLRPRLVLHAHLDKPLGSPPRLNGRIFARGADAVIAVSHAVRERLLQEHGFPPQFVRVIHNGVDVSTYAMPATWQAREWRGQVRHAWEIPDNALVIGMVGRLNAKGQDALLAIAPALVRQFPSVRIVLVGPEGEAGDRERLLALAAHSGITSQVTVANSREDIPAVMASFDVLAHLPSDESFGLALTEAMAAGLPTVATAVGGCSEVVRDGETGFLVPLGDGEALWKALSRLLEPQNGSRLRTLLGAAGRRVAETEFSLEHQIDEMLRFYARLCQVPLP